MNKNRKVNLISVFEKHGEQELVIRMGAAYTAGNKHKEITYITPSGTQTQKVAKETVIYR